MSVEHPTDRLLKEELQNKAIKAADRQGWRYGMGIALLVALAFINADRDPWHWAFPTFIAGGVFGPLGSTVFRWMEVMRQK